MNKILTITLNPAIDVRYSIENFTLGNVNRTKEIEKNAGGKGINVSRIINILGGDILATGIIGGFIGKLFLKKLNENSIKNNFLESDYETRTCIAIVDKNIDGITEILESGRGDLKVSNNFKEKFLEILQDDSIKIICASGSLLKGIDPLIYNTLIERSNEKGIKFILDTSGETLLAGIEAKPFLIKPNKEELEFILNRKLETETDIINAGKELIYKGAQNVMITLGGSGALLVTTDKIYKGTFPKVTIKNTVGSGDSTVGGFAYALSQERTLPECFKLGIACGTTNAMLDTTGTIDMDILNDILPKIKIEEVLL
ncbi:1-phosphofructokinase [Fusobacterium sp.]|uniref:1-phosphofructokinase n=1 Tax=Fusobacterium sp. TaxID=68766 RepID=UPI0025BC917C|nr:1-phosphofructokinase [Fusobacterium sp.]